jgi:hypothetical protein
MCGRRSPRACCRAPPTRRARAARRTAAAGERGLGSGLRAEVPTRAGARDRGAVNGDAGAAPRGRNHRGCPRRDSAAREVSCLMTGTYVRQATERSGRKVASRRRAAGRPCLHPGSFPPWHRQKPANVAIQVPAPDLKSPSEPGRNLAEMAVSGGADRAGRMDLAGACQDPSEDQTSSLVAIRSMTASVNSVVPAWPPRSGVLMPAATVSSTPS